MERRSKKKEDKEDRKGSLLFGMVIMVVVVMVEEAMLKRGWRRDVPLIYCIPALSPPPFSDHGTAAHRPPSHSLHKRTVCRGLSSWAGLRRRWEGGERGG